MPGLLPDSLTGLAPDTYATDEDIAIRATADYHLLCPVDQKLAYGTDGVFYATDPWTLASSSIDFVLNGVAPKQVVRLTKPCSSFEPPGELLVVQTVGPNGISLRRKGQIAGTGQSPSPPTGLSNVEFKIVTFGPQIARVSYDLNRRYGIDDLIAGRRSNDLYDPQEVRDAAVLGVLYAQYVEASRGGEDRDSFASKARVIGAELSDLLARVVIHWLPRSDPSMIATTTTKFSSRLTR